MSSLEFSLFLEVQAIMNREIKMMIIGPIVFILYLLKGCYWRRTVYRRQPIVKPGVPIY